MKKPNGLGIFNKNMDAVSYAWIDEDFDTVEYEDTKYEESLAKEYSDDNEYVDDEGQEYYK